MCFCVIVLISLSVFCKQFSFLTQKSIRQALAVVCSMLCRVVTGSLYVEQVFGGGVQKNPLFSVARQPDRLQSRLLVLCYMENHAQFQVCQHCTKNLPELKVILITFSPLAPLPFDCIHNTAVA